MNITFTGSAAQELISLLGLLFRALFQIPLTGANFASARQDGEKAFKAQRRTIGSQEIVLDNSEMHHTDLVKSSVLMTPFCIPRTMVAVRIAIMDCWSRNKTP
jgi:hypothetical protein